jgi:hypothetical protein
MSFPRSRHSLPQGQRSPADDLRRIRRLPRPRHPHPRPQDRRPHPPRGVTIGLLISLFQSVTSIQDQTLTFVPKITVMVVVAALLLPWIIGRLVEYTAEMFRLF